MTTRRFIRPAIAVLVLAGALSAAAEPTAPPAAPSAAVAEAPAEMTGRVLETLEAGTYSYLRLATDAGERWTAVPRTDAKVGATVTVAYPTAMGAFESRTLGRKFDEIWFGTLTPAAAPAPPTPTTLHGASPHGAPAGPSAVAASGPVARAPGETGYTVAEIFAKKQALSGKPVSVRGRVAKVSKAILGRNWVHLRDGSGSATTSDDDLLVTTADVVAVGDVVLVAGKVAVDRDFGSGYAYSVLVEEAKLTKEK